MARKAADVGDTAVMEIDAQAVAKVDPQTEIMARDESTSMGAELPFHPLANLFPAMSAEEYRSLKLDIAENGQLVPIYTHQGQIIDGRHRYRATRELGIAPKVQDWAGEGSVTNFVIALNLNRRHLTTSQRAAIALECLPLYEEEARQRMITGAATPTENFPEGTDNREDRTAVAQAGRTMNVSGKLVANVKRVQQIAPDLLPRIARGEITVNKALSTAAERPNADGSPREPSKARGSMKPAVSERSEGALFELYDFLDIWLSEYGKFPVLKDVTTRAKAWIVELKALESEGLDAGLDADTSGAEDD